MRNNNGFTLFELMIVVVIAGVLTTLATAGVGTMVNRLDVTNESIRFRDALLTARNLALLSGQCVTISIAPPRTVTVNSYAPTANCAAPFGAATSTATTTLATTVTLTQFDTGDPLTFNTNGGTSQAGPSSMTLTGPDRAYRYQVYPAIGQVRFQ